MIFLNYITTKEFAKKHKLSKTRVCQYANEGRIQPPPQIINPKTFIFFKDAKILKKKSRGKGKKEISYPVKEEKIYTE